jgi:hypothetical protein
MKSLAEAVTLLHRGRPPSAGLDAADLRKVLGWAMDALKDLRKLHGKGLYHGDVCPAAIRFGGRRVKLDGAGDLKAPREYRDPDRERMLNRDPKAAGRAEPRHDVFGIGATLFALLDGGPPGCGPMTPFTRSVPRAVAYVVYRAMADGPGRYPTADVMQADIRKLLRRVGRGRFEKAESERLPSFKGGRAARTPTLAPFRSRQKALAGRRASVPLRIAAVLILVLGGVALARRDRVSEAPATVEVATVAAPVARPGIAGVVDEWRARLDDRLRSVGGKLDPLDVPLLVVSDVPIRANLHWPRYPSASLTRTMRRAIDADPAPAAVQEALLDAVGRDTLPAVLRVTKKGGSLSLRFYYRSLLWETSVSAR